MPFAPDDNTDSAIELDSRIERANTRILEDATRLARAKFPHLEWGSFYQRWKAFHEEIMDSWGWDSGMAGDRLLAYRLEWGEWRKILSKHGIKDPAPRPYDPAQENPHGSRVGAFGWGAGIALVAGGAAVAYFMAKKGL